MSEEWAQDATTLGPGYQFSGEVAHRMFIAQRLCAVIEHPCAETWRDARDLIVAPGLTLWATVAHVDPTVAQDPERVPEPALVVQALRRARQAGAS